MPVKTTKPASNFRFNALPLQYLQATRYVALKETKYET